MSLRIARASSTHAVLVGIEKYAAGGDWDLSGPTRDVVGFHEWLVSRGVPDGQIQMLISPMEGNNALSQQAKINAPSATSEAVRDAFNALHTKSGELLFVFWAGHGVVSEKQHRLFLADATKHDKRNLDFDALLESLNSGYFTGFPFQIIVVDACANYQSFPFTFPGEKLPQGNPLPHEQFVFFAARQGEVARNLGGENRGLFSRELLKRLTGRQDSTWPPDMRSVAEAVQGEFASLRAAGLTEQTPVYEWNRDWDGNAIELKSLPSPAGEHSARKAPWELSFAQLTGLTDALIKCMSMSLPEGRDNVLALLRLEIRGAVPRRSDTKSDVIGILRTAANYPGGLEELLTVVNYLDGTSAGWLTVRKVVADRFPEIKMQSMESQGAPL
jgi:hypothetical protein